MKLMDEVAGIVAARHCKTNIVTASVDAINFHDKIRKGRSSLCEMRGSSLGFLVPLHTVPTPVSAHVPQEAGRERESCALPFTHAGEADLTGMAEASVPELQP